MFPAESIAPLGLMVGTVLAHVPSETKESVSAEELVSSEPGASSELLVPDWLLLSTELEFPDREPFPNHLLTFSVEEALMAGMFERSGKR
jgi:hypothetical protein